jgi:hypothetical protein
MTEPETIVAAGGPCAPHPPHSDTFKCEPIAPYYDLFTLPTPATIRAEKIERMTAALEEHGSLGYTETNVAAIVDAYDPTETLLDLMPTISAPRGGIVWHQPPFGVGPPLRHRWRARAWQPIHRWWYTRPTVRGARALRGRARDARSVWAGRKIAITEDAYEEALYD